LLSKVSNQENSRPMGQRHRSETLYIAEEKYVASNAYKGKAAGPPSGGLGVSQAQGPTLLRPTRVYVHA
jgi:hypothetical protein